MRKFTSVLLALALCAALLCIGAAAAGKDDPIEIDTPEALAEIGKTYPLDGNYILTEDIDLGGSETNPWTPIGNFNGTFDGGGHTISGLYINSSNNYAGLFGDVGGGGTVKNLTVEGSVTGSGVTGGVVGYNFGGTVSGCNSGVTVNGDTAGGVVGMNSGTVSNCYNTGAVSGESAAGVVGENYGGTVSNCYNTGAVSGKSAAGVVGMNSGTVSNCYNTGAVSGESAAGVVGENYGGTVSNCYNTGAVSGKSAAGVVGENYGGTVSNCYNTGAVTGKINAGGVYASNHGWGPIKNSYYLDTTCDVPNKGTSLSVDKFATKDSFSGWDFDTTWTISEVLGRPVLVSNPETGGGTKDDPFTIPSLNTLEYYRDKINSNGTYGDSKQYSYASANYELTANIDMSAKYGEGKGENGANVSWTPIDNFTGTFDGNGYTISGLYAVDAGLFRSIGENGVVKDLTVSGEVTGNSGSGIGGIANENYGKITGCTNKCDVNNIGFGHTGGVVGTNHGTVTDCTNTGSITTGSDTNSIGGGIAGSSDGGRISKCYNKGSVESVYYTGGIAGRIYNGGSVESCYNTGAVTGNSIYSPSAGGIVGLGGGVVSNCYNSGAVTGIGGSNVSTGGVVGCNQVAVENCYNAGEVTGNGGPYGAYTGGVVGKNTDGEISNCYNTGNVNGPDSATAKTGTGGVVGWNYNHYDIATTTNCYYLQQGEMSGIGADNGTSEKVKSKTAEEFASGEVTWLLQDGQDSGSGQVWGQTLSGDNKDGYPVLTNANRVYKVAFMEDSDTEFAAGYANSGGKVSLPESNPAAPDGSRFDGWFSDGVEFTSDTTVNADMTVTAKFTTIIVTGIDLSSDELTLKTGDAHTLTAVVTPETAADKTVNWTSSNTAVATVDADGVVTAVGAGTAVITATAADGSGVSASCAVSVSNPVLPDPTYKPVVEEPEHGEVDVTPERPKAGDTVTVRPNPDDGYTVDDITVTDKDGNKVDITRNPDGSWSFTQPEGAVTITVTFRPGTDLPFVDVSEGQWFYGYVEYVYVNGLMNGTSATTFKPNANMTRAMVWAILARIDGETVTGESWQTVAREWAMANGVSDGTDPNGLVTREQFATMLWRYAGEPASSYSLASFTDANSVSDWAATAMAWAVEHGIITGVTNTTLVPQGSATRAQCAAMLMRFVENEE